MTRRVLSGMRPTGRLHLGHLCGVLNNWRILQGESECFFFVADWHALTTEYATPPDFRAMTEEMIVTWLAVGIDPEKAVLFVQSQILEHAELHVLLSMLCPLPKLTQMPTYKEQKENIDRDLNTYGFLGYPLLQSADILAYRADGVPVGEDQLPHVELTREVARRVNHLYGGGEQFDKRVQAVLAKLPSDFTATLDRGKRRYRQAGDEAALNTVIAAIEALSLSPSDCALLRGYCLYDAEEILPPPMALLTPAAALPGTDGRKMSKSYDNTIALFDAADEVEKKIARMKTDPARQRRQDKGDPLKCPVWSLHGQFSDEETQHWAEQGCRSAGIGCLDCKKRLAGHINDTLNPIRARRTEIEDSGAVAKVLARGNQQASTVAGETLSALRRAMRLSAS